MPFLARCLYCDQRVRLPDAALGASLQCPRCSNNFTAAPEAKPPRRAAPAVPAGPSPGAANPPPAVVPRAPLPPSPPSAPAPSEAAPEAERPWWETVPPWPGGPVLPPPSAETAVDLQPARPADETEPAPCVEPPRPAAPRKPGRPATEAARHDTAAPTPQPFNLAGLAALLLNGTALLATLVPQLSGFVVPLGALGLLGGLVGVALAWAAGRPSPLSAAVGAAVGGTILFMVLLSSGRFGPASRSAWGAAPPRTGTGPVGPPPIHPQTGMPLDTQ